MKAFNTIVKILAALAAIAGAIYVVATYGDKIVDWAKKLWARMPQCGEAEAVPEADFVAEEAPAAEPAQEAEEVQEVQEPAEAPAQEPEIPETDPVADETDFAE